MPKLPVDTAVVVTVGPIIDDTDFKTRETAVAYNAAGMDVDLHKSAVAGTKGTVVKVDITPQDPAGGSPGNRWTAVGGGYYELELTAAQNDTEGELQVVGLATGVLPFESPVYEVVPQQVFNSLVAGGDRLQADAVEVSGDAAAADNLESYCDGSAPQPVNATHLEGQALGAKAGDNFNAFFHNGGADTAKVVDDVGGGAAGGTDWTDAERTQIRKALGLDGTAADTTGAGNLDAVLRRLAGLLAAPAIGQGAVTAAGQDVARYRGDSVPLAFDLGRDITGASFEFTVKRRATDPQADALIAKSSAEASEIEITDEAAGQFLVKLAAADTADLLPDGRRAAFLYDVEMTLDGAVETVAAGDFVLLPDVTTAA